MFKRAAAALLLLAATVSAGVRPNCSDLKITQRTLGRSQIVSIHIENTLPEAFTVLCHGQNPGTTTIPMPGNVALTLGLGEPFNVTPMGITNDDGDLTRRLRLRADLGIKVTAQAVSIQRDDSGRAPRFRICETNPVRLVL